MRLAVALAAVLVALPPGPTFAAGASAWSEHIHSRIRLLDGGTGADGALLAGIEIALDPGFKTYWRSPGESGVPPAIDSAGSVNLASVELLFPAPVAFADGGGTSNGYLGGVVLPLRVTATDPARPVTLRIRLAYGACERICVPAEGEATLALGALVAPPHAAAVAAALATVPPRREGFGAPDGFGLLALREVAPRDATQRLALDVAGGATAIFVEGPKGWFVEATREGERHVAALHAPRRRPVAEPCPLVFTIVGEGRAVEQAVTLPRCGPAP